jgi:LmbE family N-acetylglucosaminyl deacetylase
MFSLASAAREDDAMTATKDRLLVVVAHPDDETFGCGSLLAHASECGVSTTIACATRGEAGSPTPGRGLDDADMAVVREAELREAAALMGVKRVELFDWVDSEMAGTPAPGTLVAAPIEEVAARIASLIDDVKPTVVVTLDASDGHRDHAHIRDATLRAATSSSWRPDRVYLHCLPQQLMRKWVEALVEQHPESEHLGLGELGTPQDQITTVIDSTRYLDLREQAIALHRSQSSPYEVMSAELRREFLTNECLCRVHPEWNGGPIETEIFVGANSATTTTRRV